METKAFQEVEKQRYDDDEALSDQQYAKVNNASELSGDDIEGAIKLNLRLKKKIVQSSSFNSQTFPMLVSLIVDNLKSSNKAPLDLICVIDHSGSMNGEKIKLVKNAFTYLFKYLGDLDRISIVIFDDKATRLVPLLRTTELNKKRILSAVRNIQGAGGTDINLGMMHAFQTIKQRRYINPVTSIFLLSDGLDDKAQQRVKESLVKFNIPDDVTINTFGFGSDHDPQLMNDIADQRDGNFYVIHQLDTIDETFIDCLGGLFSSIAQSAQIKVKPEQSNALNGVEIIKAYGGAGMWAKLQDTYVTKMTSLISGKQRDYVFEIKLPASVKELQDHEKNIPIASAEVEVLGLNNEIVVKKAELYVTLLNEVEEMKEEEEDDDKEVMNNYYRVKGALVMDEARKLADAKRNDEAKKLLQNFKEELVNSSVKGNELIKNLVKDIDMAIVDVNPKVYQEIGRHNVIANARAQMCQKPNLASHNYYGNAVQSKMVTEVRSMKSAKK